jgi:hypothetical protein
MSEFMRDFWTIASFTVEKSSRMLRTSEASVILRSSKRQLRVTQERKDNGDY